MANRSFYRAQNSYARELVMVPCTININASNVVTSVTMGSPNTTAVTAARSAAGTYDITFADSFQSLVSATFTVQAATAVDRVVQISSVSLATKVIQVKELATATATDVGAAHAIHCMFVFSNV